MAEKTPAAVQFQEVAMTAAQFTSQNPTLLKGQMGIETDTLMVKVGNESTAWTGRPYLQGGCPTGGFIYWSGVSLPSGYLPCDGRAVSRTTYSALYNMIGTVWGAGDGSTTFNLPNLVNRTVHGIGNSTGSIASGTFDQAHTHNSGDIHGVGGAWGNYIDSYGYYEYYSGTPGWCAYPLEMPYFMDNPKSVGEINHGTGVWGSSTEGGNPPPFMYRKVLIKY